VRSIFLYILLLAQVYEERGKKKEKDDLYWENGTGEKDSRSINKIADIHHKRQERKAKFGHHSRSSMIRERIQTSVKRKKSREKRILPLLFDNLNYRKR